MSIEDYIEEHTSTENDVLSYINHDTNVNILNPHMLSGRVQGRFLAMISHMIRPDLILELGTFTGYSALCLAEGLTEHGKLITLEHNDELEATIRHNLSLSPLGHKIDLHITDAKAFLCQWSSLVGKEIDLVFIDADKREYAAYLDLVLPLVKKGGFILADNTLWDGHVVDPHYDRDAQTRALRLFNDKVHNTPYLEHVILPLRDGLSILRVKD